MEKYKPLADHLRESSQDTLSMTFDEIEQIIGGKLPPSAFEYRAWWSNNPTNSVMTHAWLGAGYKTVRVDMPGRTLEFQKVSPEEPSTGMDGGQPSRKEPHPFESDANTDFYFNIFGALKGTVTITAGTDPTSPVGEEWEIVR